MGRGAGEVRTEAGHLGELPLTVITAGRRAPGPTSEALHTEWLVLQAELVALSRQAIQVIAQRAGHHVHRDEPQLVAQVIGDLVEQVRAGG